MRHDEVWNLEKIDVFLTCKIGERLCGFYVAQSAKGNDLTARAETNRKLSGIAERVAPAIRTSMNLKKTGNRLLPVT